MKPYFAWLLLTVLPFAASGCSLFNNPDREKSGSERGWAKLIGDQEDRERNSTIANPPARTIRFDGHEIVLGNGEASSLPPDKLSGQLKVLLEKRKIRSASALTMRHPETAERLLCERWGTDASDPIVQFTAEIMQQRFRVEAQGWSSLLRLALRSPEDARTYQKLRNHFATTLQTSDPTSDDAARLQQVGQKLGHPLVTVDYLRLLALKELLSGRAEWSESLYRQAIKVAEESQHWTAAADLWLMVVETSQRAKFASDATDTKNRNNAKSQSNERRSTKELDQAAHEAWQRAIECELKAMGNDSRWIEPGFWTRAELMKPSEAQWPENLREPISPHLHAIGINTRASVTALLWAAVAQAQYERNEYQAALIHFKKAEADANGDDVQWLRIAQSRCLSALGQVPAASAILSGPATNAEPSIAAAAMAAMGSAKLQAGAYQQGAQLINKAIKESANATWPGKPQAQADLALAQLILGETDQGLTALHSAQSQFAQQRDVLSLLQSLENELRILEHEGRSREAAAIQTRIRELETGRT